MTRKSEREVERALERLESRQQTNTDVALMIAPDFSFPDMDLPDVSRTGIRATSSETGVEEIVVPHHRPDAWWRDRVPIVPESCVAAVWHNMTPEQLARERSLREERGDPIPPFLEERT